MDKPTLFAPWRMDYIRSLEKPEDGCFFCLAATAPASQYADRCILWQTPHVVVLMNRFPYTNGHLLIAPKAHKADLGELDPDELADLSHQTVLAIELLKRAISPQGFNIGINLGRCAGAGVPGHLHQHLVPRWNGDANFMSVIADIRVVPQATQQLHGELLRLVPEIVKP